MEVYKRPGSPSWYVDLVHPATGARIRQSLKFSGSKVEAQRRASRRQHELETEAQQYENGRKPTTIGEAVDRYIASLDARGQRSAPLQAYRRDRLFGVSATSAGLFTLQPDQLLHDLSPAKLEELVLARTREGKKSQTIKHEISLLRAASRYAASLGYRTPNLMVRGEVQNPWRVPAVGVKTRYLSVQEYQKVYDYLDPERPSIMRMKDGREVSYDLQAHLKVSRQEVRDLLVALAYTGGRWSEVAQLTWDRVDLPGGVLRLWAGKVEKERLVPIADPLREVLRRRGRDGYASPSRLVFPGPYGRVRKAPTQAIAGAMSEVGLNAADTVAKYGRASAHSLRHTFASWLIQNGADLGEVSDALGHSNLNMTKRYAHLAKGKTMAKLGNILSTLTAGKDDAITAQ